MSTLKSTRASVSLVYCWELMPKQLFASFKPTRDSKISVTQGVNRPFDTEKRTLESTPFEYQLGLGADSHLLDLAPIREAFPAWVIPGEHRSGIIVLADDKVIASFVAGGHVESPRIVHVAKAFRGKGLGTRMVSQWYREVPRVTSYPTQLITLHMANTLLGAHEDAVSWAVATNQSVPTDVINAIEHGAERKEILAAFAKL